MRGRGGSQELLLVEYAEMMRNAQMLNCKCRRSAGKGYMFRKDMGIRTTWAEYLYSFDVQRSCHTESCLSVKDGNLPLYILHTRTAVCGYGPPPPISSRELFLLPLNRTSIRSTKQAASKVEAKLNVDIDLTSREPSRPTPPSQ